MDDQKHAILKGQILPNMTFSQKVWALTSRIPKGKVTTYGDIANALSTKAYRAVGMALNRNPYAPQVPCHRVVAQSGTLGGFAFGLPEKIKLLHAEGIEITNDQIDMNKFSFSLTNN